MDITRWRNSHGFGVHSPFGFKIAKGVVSPGREYSYYAEPKIYSLAIQEKYSGLYAEHLIKLHRLAAMLQIRDAYVAMPLNRCQRVLLAKAGVRISKFREQNISENTPDERMQKLYMFNGNLRTEVADEILSIPGNILVIYSDNPTETSQLLMKHIKTGIVITGNFCTYAFSRSQTQPVCYRMNL